MRSKSVTLLNEGKKCLFYIGYNKIKVILSVKRKTV